MIKKLFLKLVNIFKVKHISDFNPYDKYNSGTCDENYMNNHKRKSKIKPIKKAGRVRASKDDRFENDIPKEKFKREDWKSTLKWN